MANGQLNDAERLWIAGSESIRRTVPDATWRAWFDAIRPVDLDDTTLVLAVPSAVVRDRLERQYGELIADALSDALGQSFSVQFEVHVLPDAPADLEDLAEGLDTADPAQGTLLDGATLGGGTEPEPAGAPLNPRFTFEAFVIGSSNRFAHAAALAVAERPARAYNPLFIHGGAGLGKTHLLHGIGNYVRENFPTAYVRYVSTETFLNEFVTATRTNTHPALRRRYRECDVLLVDDIQFMEGKEGLQEEFFHTFNDLQAAGKQIVITSDRPPKAIATLEVRLTSRFMSGLTTDVQPPDLETRLAILHKKAESERTEVPHDVCEFIASNVKDNIRELEGALTRVCAYSSLNGEPLTGELAERVLGDMFGADKPRQITPQLIIDNTAKMFGFTVDELCGPSRRRPLVTARQIGMYVCRELTDYSYPAIAREFGGRDHTTVIHAVEKIGGLMGERRAIFDQVTELIGTIRRGG